MGQVLANLSSNLNIIYFKKETSIKTYIPFENNEQDFLTCDKIMSYLNKEQKFKYKLKKDEYIFVENLKVRNIRICQYNDTRWHNKYEPYEDIQYYFEKGETYENTEAINKILNYEMENSNFELV
jgi:hypothetical protein